jgi:hypothetical protein
VFLTNSQNFSPPAPQLASSASDPPEDTAKILLNSLFFIVSIPKKRDNSDKHCFWPGDLCNLNGIVELHLRPPGWCPEMGGVHAEHLHCWVVVVNLSLRTGDLGAFPRSDI